MDLKKLTIVYGHYGCGKTNFSLNLALDIAKTGKKVKLVDMDIVNPYFRSSDYQKELLEKGIEVIAPGFAGSNLDTPALSAKIYSVFADTDSQIIFDVGGDDAGAFALGRFSKNIKEAGEYTALYVINKYRNFTATPQLACEILSEIEKACTIKAAGIINNSHLQDKTTAEDIIEGIDYAEKTAKLLNLPIMATTAPKTIANNKKLDKYKIYPVDIIVKPPF